MLLPETSLPFLLLPESSKDRSRRRATSATVAAKDDRNPNTSKNILYLRGIFPLRNIPI